MLKNLGEATGERFQLSEPEGRVLKSPGASLRFFKKRDLEAKRDSFLYNSQSMGGPLLKLPCFPDSDEGIDQYAEDNKAHPCGRHDIPHAGTVH